MLGGSAGCCCRTRRGGRELRKFGKLRASGCYLDSGQVFPRRNVPTARPGWLCPDADAASCISADTQLAGVLRWSRSWSSQQSIWKFGFHSPVHGTIGSAGLAAAGTPARSPGARSPLRSWAEARRLPPILATPLSRQIGVGWWWWICAEAACRQTECRPHPGLRRTLRIGTRSEGQSDHSSLRWNGPTLQLLDLLFDRRATGLDHGPTPSRGI